MMKIEDFKGKRVTVMGIGLHGGGVGVINFFAQNGARVLATDLRSRRELRESLIALSHLKNVRYVFGRHREEDFIETDLVIKNPAVPEDSQFLKIAKDHDVKIETDIGIFFELCPSPIIGITGSRGKSTTSYLTYQILKQKHHKTVLAGNIRMSVLEKLNQIKPDSLTVLELSSWQLAGLKSHKKSPHFAVVTNIIPDHLNRYASMADYVADKKIVFEFQKKNDFLVLNYDDETVRGFAKKAKSKIYYYSTDAKAISELEAMPQTAQEARLGAYAAGGKIFFGAAKEEVAEISDINLLGHHNLSNVLAAITLARLFNIPTHSIKDVLHNFKGLEGRLQLIKEILGIKFFNDTTATIPEATMAAINNLIDKSPSPKIILISGGADKNLDFSALAQLIAKKVKAALLLQGTATPKLEKQIKKQVFLEHRRKFLIKKFDNIEKAVKTAFSLANSGDIILLSPGCASFGLFRHEFERGERFNEVVSKLANG